MLFTVEIDEEWFDALDSLIETVLGKSKDHITAKNAATVEEAMEITILFQLRLQRTTEVITRHAQRNQRFPVLAHCPVIPLGIRCSRGFVRRPRALRKCG